MLFQSIGYRSSIAPQYATERAAGSQTDKPKYRTTHSLTPASDVNEALPGAPRRGRRASLDVLDALQPLGDGLAELQLSDSPSMSVSIFSFFSECVCRADL